MTEATIPSLSTSVVGSRFISQGDIESAKARRDEEWKAAYARLGQEPPVRPVEDSFDGRSLAEKLAANRVAKQEEWEEKTKLANQFRALEEDEIMFLDSLREKQEAEERQRKLQDGEEIKSFKQAVAARSNASNNPPPILSSKPAPIAPKKDTKKSLKGVLVKKRTKSVSTPKEPETPAVAPIPHRNAEDNRPDEDDRDEQLPAKRQKVSET